ncbi:MAG: type IX secretion system protein PorQ [Bacteroidales bacterium]|nr:type IX secretion system protein PorQ [Bacteroidales bacterium]
MPFTALKAQVAGMNTLSLLQMPSSARTAALGVDFLSVYSPRDISVGINNASLIGEGLHRRLQLDYVGLFSGSKYCSAAYGLDTRRFGVFLLGLHYYGYGSFEQYDEMDVRQGHFSASDMALMVGWGMHIDSNFSIGASLKPVLSQYDAYRAFAFSLDVSGSYVSDNKRFAATVQARRVGAQLATFDGTVEAIPFNLAASCSFKAENAPFRLFFEMDHLTRWDLGYNDPLRPETHMDPYTGLPIAKPWYDKATKVLENVARHASLGLEIDIKKVFFIRLGYRFRQTLEMGADDRTNINISGFSYGFGLQTKRFEFSFARRNYHLGQAPNFVSLAFKI